MLQKYKAPMLRPHKSLGCGCQVVGNRHMGMGYALTEDIIIGPLNSNVLNLNCKDYKLLTSLDMPKVQTILAETC